ncbi:3-deoxy-manno-octulosonate cytidylyltransferase [Spirosoma sp. 209]|uniref:3-deoxy-manno-octulosonate cytidylyltransferase n=1 Tax=Spirosoma sp. 209 TaxID=1955701 RepID=UPI00098D009D|nr:3-deoxy-manno-octulosonate cytidylyltransferase [Spirosoma sp. 209]
MIIGIIPARYGSTRFPGKPLADIGGKPMIVRVLEQAWQAQLLDRVVVATDDERIAEVVRQAGGEVAMTHSDHVNGTQRCQEAYAQLAGTGSLSAPGPHYVVNIQGDEPFINPAQIDELAAVLDGSVELATQMSPVESAEILHSTGEVKIVLNAKQEALYFSRQPIPFFRDLDPARWHEHHPYQRHVGLYGYRADILEKIAALPIMPLQQAESLEQLAWLEAGYCIKLVTTVHQSQAVDDPSDIDRALQSSRQG